MKQIPFIDENIINISPINVSEKQIHDLNLKMLNVFNYERKHFRQCDVKRLLGYFPNKLHINMIFILMDLYIYLSKKQNNKIENYKYFIRYNCLEILKNMFISNIDERLYEIACWKKINSYDINHKHTYRIIFKTLTNKNIEDSILQNSSFNKLNILSDNDD